MLKSLLIILYDAAIFCSFISSSSVKGATFSSYVLLYVDKYPIDLIKFFINFFTDFVDNDLRIDR